MDDCHQFDEEEQTEYRKLELEFEEKYKVIYDQREKLINGKDDDSYSKEDILKEFEETVTKFKDDDYEKLIVEPCDVKAIQNTPKGISDFWIKALLNHPLGEMIFEKDRPILGYLENITLDLHEGDKNEGFDLTFKFASNSYFK